MGAENPGTASDQGALAAWVSGSVVDDCHAASLQVGETVLHGMHLVGRVPHPVLELTDDSNGLTRAVGAGGVPGILLVREVRIIFKSAGGLYEVDAAATLA